MTLADALCYILGLGCMAAPAKLPPVRAEGIATVYGYPGDPQSGPTLGCVREARRLLGSERIRPDLPIVAMRPEQGVPCGGVLWVERGERRVMVTRLDSGSYGRHPDGRYRGIVDLSPAVAEAVGLPGTSTLRRGRVRLRWW